MLCVAVPGTSAWSCGALGNVSDVCGDSSTSCQVAVRTGGLTCGEYCSSEGLTCTNGWASDSECSSKGSEVGCDRSYTRQICQCDLSLCAASDIDFTDACEESNQVCEAAIRTNGRTCDQVCEASGLQCTTAWASDSTCGSRGSETDCSRTHQRQICRCEGSVGQLCEDARVVNDDVCFEDGRTCEAAIRTNGRTCDEVCEQSGLQCVTAWSADTTCSSRGSETDCNRSHQRQICRCEGSAPLPPPAGDTFDPTKFVSGNPSKGEFKPGGLGARLESPSHAVLFVQEIGQTLDFDRNGDWWRIRIPWKSDVSQLACSAPQFNYGCLARSQKCFCSDSCVTDDPCPLPNATYTGDVPNCARNDATCQAGTGDFRIGFFDMLTPGYTVPSSAGPGFTGGAQYDGDLRSWAFERYDDMRGWYINLFPHVSSSTKSIPDHPNQGIYINTRGRGPLSGHRRVEGGGFEVELGSTTYLEVYARRVSSTVAYVEFSMNGKDAIGGELQLGSSLMPRSINSIWLMYVNNRKYSVLELGSATITSGSA